jgi:hypothetical protein
MHARVMSGQVSPDQLNEFRSMIHDNVIPRASKIEGFQGGYWLADSETGQVLGITLYESEKALRDSEEQANRIREEASRAAGLPVPTFKHYEVVATTGAEAARKAA